MQTTMTAFGLAAQRHCSRITDLTQQLTNLGQTPSTPVNTTPSTTTGIQTIPQERPPATPSRAAVSQYLGSRQARRANTTSPAPTTTQTTNATINKIQTNGIDIEIFSISICLAMHKHNSFL